MILFQGLLFLTTIFTFESGIRGVLGESVRDHVELRVRPNFTFLSHIVLHNAVLEPTYDCGPCSRILRLGIGLP